jgi:3-hydroxyisobutyrate dehydrogenase
MPEVATVSTATPHASPLPTVGFIGLGHMGGHMSAHLLAAGYPLVVHDINPAAASRQLALGAQWAGSPERLAARCELVITMLPGPRQVESVIRCPGARPQCPGPTRPSLSA